MSAEDKSIALTLVYISHYYEEGSMQLGKVSIPWFVKGKGGGAKRDGCCMTNMYCKDCSAWSGHTVFLCNSKLGNTHYLCYINVTISTSVISMSKQSRNTLYLLLIILILIAISNILTRGDIIIIVNMLLYWWVDWSCIMLSLCIIMECRVLQIPQINK